MTTIANSLDAIAKVTAAIGTAQTLPAIFDAALDGLREAFGVERASILLFDDDGVMRFKAWRGLSPEYRAATEGHTPWAFGQAAPPPVVVPNVRTDAALARFASVFERERIDALAFFPLISARGVIGKFMLYRSEAGVFSADQVNAGNTIGYVLGFAVERTQRIDDAQREHGRVLFALDAASMGTWEWDISAQRVRWSDNLERIHGLPPGTFTGGFESYEREIHPDDRPRVLSSLQRAIGEDVPHDVEYRVVAPDGTVRWVQGRGRVERDDAGTPVRMTGVCMDISERRRVEEENQRLYAHAQQLLADEESLRARLTTLTDGSFRLLTSLNAKSVVGEVLALAEQVVTADAYALWQRRNDEWTVAGSRGLGDAFVAARVPYDRGRMKWDEPVIFANLSEADLQSDRMRAHSEEGIAALVAIPLAVRGEPTGSVTFYYRRPHQPSELELRVAVALGHLAVAAISNAELYEQQQALRHAAEAAQLRSTFLAEASAHLSSLDYEANLREVAQLAVPRLCDWCAVDLRADEGSLKRVTIAHVDPAKVALDEELQRRYPVDLTQPRGIGQVLRTGEPELYAQISDGMLAPVAVDAEHLRTLRVVGMRSAMLVPLAAGDRVFGVMSFVICDDRRPPYNEADLALVSELGRRAAFAIENARLYAEAQHANRLKDEFLATLSHELRTPLNVIAGRARMIAHVSDVAQAREFAGIIDRNSTTLARLVDDLLDVSRMTIGQVTLERQPVDLAAVLSAAIQSVQSAAEAKNVSLASAMDGDGALVGDAVRIQQIAWNLLTNAVKFTPAGGRVGVTASCSDGTVSLIVRDSGRGIAPEMLPRVFDMFWQAEPLAERPHGGLGLGLSIVRKLAELHGGSVRADSDGVGKGATFTVVLPRTSAPPAA
jgi:PAS domain S-box-containing protein